MDVDHCTTSSAASSDYIAEEKTSNTTELDKNCASATKEVKKRQRTTFSQSQLRILEEAFTRQQYLVGSERVRLAALLNIGVPQVKIWFQNRRIRWRREQRELLMGQPSPLSAPATSSSGMTSSNHTSSTTPGITVTRS